MKLKLLTFLINSTSLFLAALLVSSCGTGKKLAASQAEAAELKKKNAELEQSVASLKTEVSNLGTQNKALAADFTNYKNGCEVDRQNLKDIKGVLNEEAQTMGRLQLLLEAAMADFSSKDVQVQNKKGMLYVSLPHELLYKSGSANLEEKGKKALGSLAAALNDFPKLQVFVVGNTDTTMFKKGSDNWTLSTERANGVVRTLRDDYKVDPSRLVAAGRGRYNPVASNSTAEGRAKNRRIDIILNPDLERLWNSVRK